MIQFIGYTEDGEPIFEDDLPKPSKNAACGRRGSIVKIVELDRYDPRSEDDMPDLSSASREPPAPREFVPEMRSSMNFIDANSGDNDSIHSIELDQPTLTVAPPRKRTPVSSRNNGGFVSNGTDHNKKRSGRRKSNRDDRRTNGYEESVRKSLNDLTLDEPPVVADEEQPPADELQDPPKRRKKKRRLRDLKRPEATDERSGVVIDDEHLPASPPLPVEPEPEELPEEAPKVRKKKKKRRPREEREEEAEVLEDAKPPGKPPMGPRPLKPQVLQQGESSLSGMFRLEGHTFDVLLYDAKIKWKSVELGGLKKKKKRKSSGLWRSGSRRSLASTAASDTEDEYDGHLDLQTVFGVKVKRVKRGSSHGEDEGVCEGIVVFAAEPKGPNKLREKIYFFEHPSEDLCVVWVNKIDEIIKGYICRPRNMRMYLQPFAGSKKTRLIWKKTLMPLFEKAGNRNIKVVEINHNEAVKQDFCHLELDEYDCVIALGGDGTVSAVVDGLLSRSQALAGAPDNLKFGFAAAPAHIPLAILPCGTSNHIARSIHGIDDLETAALRLMLGHSMWCDATSVYEEDKLVHWGFEFFYGFGGAVARLQHRYKALGARRVEMAFLKSLTKKSLRPYPCDVHFILSKNAAESHPQDDVMCCRECDVCGEASGSQHQDSTFTDTVEILEPSGKSPAFQDMTAQSEWQTVKGDYLNVGVLTLPSRSEVAPQGMSKYAHLGDGCCDLVLVKATARKNFIRHLKRHGNSKDQFDYDFVEVYRCQEVQIRPRTSTTWRHRNHQFDEIAYEIEKKKKKIDKRRGTVHEKEEQVIDMGSDSESEGEDDFSRDLPDIDDAENDSDAIDGGEGSLKSRDSPTEDEPKSRIRLTFYEQERKRRKRQIVKRETKARIKDEGKEHGPWAFDSETKINGNAFSFKVHAQLLCVYGVGPSPDTERSENRMLCLPTI